MNDDFKNNPKSINELKVNKENNGALWKPRDALISLLREIDNGLEIDNLIIGYSIDNKDNNHTFSYIQSCKDFLTAAGLWSMVNKLLLQ